MASRCHCCSAIETRAGRGLGRVGFEPNPNPTQNNRFDKSSTQPNPPTGQNPTQTDPWMFRSGSRTPPVGSYKINTDGCVKDGFASGGGIIRDSSDRCIHAFFSSYGECSIMEVELGAILDGVIIVHRIVLSDDGLSPTLLWPFTASLKMEDLGLFRLLFTTSDISLLSTVILFLIFIARTTM
ncbi:Uncharacterized protein Adt_19434 [Abeliophyllum distichum]|uniref:RNase H type-1 domain-containing protein n=1 Tax=Abeliophyllum distichum TaxID=126358 RepID=A0ABD1SVC0_9LAMI